MPTAEALASLPALTPRPVADSIDELLAGATERVPMKTFDSLSGAPFERVRIGGSAYVVKYLSVDSDWIMRASGDLGCRAVTAWRTGLLDALPGCLDHTMVGAAWDAPTRTAALLMHDVGSLLVPEETPLTLAENERFVDHMAAMHARFWGFGREASDALGLMAPDMFYATLSPLMSQTEAECGHSDPVPTFLPQGYAALRAEVPDVAAIVEAIHVDPTPLVDALATTPWTFVHHDWKAGNLGSHDDGRTILLDWAFPSADAGCVDLGWYLAVNCDRLPVSKEATIDSYRAALERHGVDTTGWFDTQLGLGLLSAFAQLGWSKAGGDPAEIGWWLPRVREAAGWL